MIKSSISLYENHNQFYQYLGIVYLSPRNEYTSRINFCLSNSKSIDPIYCPGYTYFNHSPQISTLIPNKLNNRNFRVYYNINSQYICLTHKDYQKSPYILHSFPPAEINQMVQDPRDPDNYVKLVTSLNFSKYKYSKFWYATCLPRLILNHFLLPKTGSVLIYKDQETLEQFHHAVI